MEAAKVIMLAEYGDKRMRAAIAEGLVSGELKKDIEDTLKEVDIVKHENDILKRENTALRAAISEYTRIHVQAYGACLNKRSKRWRRSPKERTLRGIITIAVGITAMVTITLAGFILLLA